MHAIWDWILIEKLYIPHSERNMYSAVLVLPETFDNRGNDIWGSSFYIDLNTFRWQNLLIILISVPKLLNTIYDLECFSKYHLVNHTFFAALGFFVKLHRALTFRWNLVRG